MAIPFAITVFWILIAVGLFGLARFHFARRALDEDWLPLAAFGHALQATLQSHGNDADALAALRDLAPRIRAQTIAYARRRPLDPATDPFSQVDLIASGLAKGAGAGEAEAARLALEALRGQVLGYESFLQGEMKQLAKHGASPGYWLAAGARGLLLLPLGLAFGGNVEQRALRRDHESDPRLVGASNLILVVLAALAVAAIAALTMQWFAAVRSGLEH